MEATIDALAARIEALGDLALSPASTAAVRAAVEQFKKLDAKDQLALFEAEMRKKMALQEKLDRMTRMKEKLEVLSRELSARNNQLNAELRHQDRQHKELKEKFEAALQDIAAKLQGQQMLLEENEKLRDNIKQLLKLEEMKEDHYKKTLAAKDLELQLLEAKRQQALEQAQVLQQRLEQSLRNELSLQHQIAEYATRFQSMDKLFSEVRENMQKMDERLRGAIAERDRFAKTAAQANLSLIECQEQRLAERSEYEKLQAQHEKLKALLHKTLMQQKASATASAPAADSNLAPPAAPSSSSAAEHATGSAQSDAGSS